MPSSSRRRSSSLSSVGTATSHECGSGVTSLNHSSHVIGGPGAVNPAEEDCLIWQTPPPGSLSPPPAKRQALNGAHIKQSQIYGEAAVNGNDGCTPITNGFHHTNGSASQDELDKLYGSSSRYPKRKSTHRFFELIRETALPGSS